MEVLEKMNSFRIPVTGSQHSKNFAGSNEKDKRIYLFVIQMKRRAVFTPGRGETQPTCNGIVTLKDREVHAPAC